MTTTIAQAVQPRPAVDVAEMMREAHGIDVDLWRCPHCDRLFSESDRASDYCHGCRWPLPVRCSRAGCDGWWQSRDGYSEEPLCESCRAGAPARRRESAVRVGIPEHVLAPALAYWPSSQSSSERLALNRVLMAWSEEQYPGWLLVWGGNGTGKTTAVVRAARRAVLDGVVGSVLYATEQEIHAAASDRVRDDSIGIEAQRLLNGARSVDLLIFDEYRREDPRAWSDAQRQQTERLLVHRADRKLRTVVVSNHAPARDGFLSELSHELASRAAGASWGYTVHECSGADLRRAA